MKEGATHEIGVAIQVLVANLLVNILRVGLVAHLKCRDISSVLCDFHSY